MADIRLYQIGRESGVTDSRTTLAEELPKTSSGDGNVSSVDINDDPDSVFPDGKDFYIQINDEILLARQPKNVVGMTGNTLNIVGRGQHGTETQTHSSGSTVHLVTDADAATSDEIKKILELEEFVVYDIGTIEETIEHEKGQFRISNVSFTIGEGPNYPDPPTPPLEERFGKLGDIQSPWVLEVKNDSDEVIFTGFVKKDSTFNAGTEKISLQAVSFLEILSRAGDIPGRAIYETEVLNAKRGAEISEGQIQVDILDDPRLSESGNQVGNKNDTLAIDTEKGEVRQVIQSAEVIGLENKEEDLRRMTISLDTGVEDAIIDTSDSTISDQKVQANGVEGAFDLTTGDRVAETTRIYFETLSDDVVNKMAEFAPWDEGEYAALLFDSSDTLVQTIIFDERDEYDPNNLQGLTYKSEIRTANLNAEFVANHEYHIIVKSKGNEEVFKKLAAIQEGDEVKLLGQEIWGYSGEIEGGSIREYASQTLIDALMTVNDEAEGQPLLGVLTGIYGSTSYDIGGSDSQVYEPIDPRVEFPSDPMDALRMIQQISGFLLVEDTTTQTNSDGDVIPQVNYRILPRERMTGDSVDEVSANIASNVLSWEENVAEDNINAVVVETNEQYGGGGDRTEVAGWFYDSINQDEQTDKPTYTTKPKGNDVIEVEVNAYPAHEGVIYTGGDTEIRNDIVLKAIAEKFYRHFTSANRDVTIELGRDNPDVLGKVVSFDEGRKIDDRALITSKQFHIEDGHRETTLQGRIAGKSFDLITDPTPVINGSNVFRADSNDEVTVRLSGINSFDEASGTLSYSWNFNSNTSSGAQLERTLTITDRQRKTVTLTVTNNNTGNSASTSEDIVLEPFTGVENPPLSNDVTVEKKQVSNLDGNNDRWGRLVIEPKDIPSLDTDDVDSDGNDELLVQYVAKRGGEISLATIDNSDWITVGSAETDEDIDGDSQVKSRINDQNGSPQDFEVDVQLDEKHVSTVLLRLQWQQSSGFKNTLGDHTFDFDKIPNIRNVDAYRNGNDEVTVDFEVDEDASHMKLEYRKNSNNASDFSETQGSVNGSPSVSAPQTGYVITDNSTGNNVTVGAGDFVDVRFTPQNSSGDSGPSVIRRVEYSDRADILDGEVTIVKALRKSTSQNLPQLVYRPNSVSNVQTVEARISDGGDLDGSQSFQTITRYTQPSAGFNATGDYVVVDGLEEPLFGPENQIEFVGGTDAGVYDLVSVTEDQAAIQTQLEIPDVTTGWDINDVQGFFYAIELDTYQGSSRQVELKITFTNGESVSNIYTISADASSESAAKGSGNLEDRTDFTDQQAVFAQGLSSTGDGDGGPFYYDSGSGALPDGTNVISPNNVSGRLIRMVQNLPKAQYVQFEDTSTQPSSNGEFRQDGSDVYVQTGGVVKNLSNIVNGSSGVDVADDGTVEVSGVSQINFGGEYFDVTNPTGDEVKVELTSSSITLAELDESISSSPSNYNVIYYDANTANAWDEIAPQFLLNNAGLVKDSDLSTTNPLATENDLGTNSNSLTDGSGIASFSYDGSSAESVAHSSGLGSGITNSGTTVIQEITMDTATSSHPASYSTIDLSNEFVPLTRNIDTGTGLAGGGDLSTDRTLTIDAELAELNESITASPNDHQIIYYDGATANAWDETTIAVLLNDENLVTNSNLSTTNRLATEDDLGSNSNSLTDGQGIVDFTYDGSTAETVAHKTGLATGTTNSGGTVVQGWTLDTGTTSHIASVSTVDLDTRYPRNSNNETITGSWTFESKTTFNIGTSSGGTVQTEWQNGSSDRWKQGLVNNESGSNTGSNLIWWSYDDTGSFLSAVLRMIRSSGNVQVYNSLGVGKTPSYSIHSSGDIAADGAVRDLSDVRKKTDLEPITSALNKASSLSGYTYDRTDRNVNRTAGLIAQEVEEVFPEAVSEEEWKNLDLGAMLALAFNAINELNQKIDEHRS